MTAIPETSSGLIGRHISVVVMGNTDRDHPIEDAIMDAAHKAGDRYGFDVTVGSGPYYYEGDETDRKLAEVTAERDLLTGALGSLWLYVDWRWLTKQLTTEEKEAWATCVQRWSADLNEGSAETPVDADRWWLCPTCGISIRAKAEDGPHERCKFANDADGDMAVRTRGPAEREAGPGRE